MQKVDLYLLAVINQIIADLADSTKHYLVVAKYYFFHDKLTNFAPVYFNCVAIEDIQLLEDGLKCKLVFTHGDPDGKFIIRMPYDQIGKISECDYDDFIEEHILFMNEEVMLQHYNTSQRVNPA